MRHNRRDFLKLNAGFFFFNPIDFLSTHLCQRQWISCPENHTELKNYVLFHFAGGPARWQFDSPLAPRAHHDRMPNPMVVTRLKDKKIETSDDLEFEYATTAVNGYQMPWMWSYPSVESVRSQGELKRLLGHAVIIRGCRMGADGHSLNGRRLVLPNQSYPSTTGLIGDRSPRELPAIGMTGSQYPVHATPLGAFSSSMGRPLIVLNKYTSDYFNALFEGFLVSKSSSKEEAEVIDAILQRSHSISSTTIDSRSQARSLLKRDLRLLKEQFINRRSLYQRIINESLNHRGLIGLTDQRIPGLERERLQRKDQGNLSYFFKGDFFIGDHDLRDSLETIQFHGLADQFAMTELLLVNKLSSSISIDVPSPSNLNLKTIYSSRSYDSKKGRLNPEVKAQDSIFESDRFFSFDSHDYGLIPHHLYNGIFYYAFTNCLLEMTDRLKERGVYQETLIHVTSEFDREPRPDMMGSEHGFSGQLNMFLSEKIHDFKIIGNILNDNNGTFATFRNIGTWGEGGKLRFLNNRPIVYGNIASTISSLMGIPTPSPNDAPLMRLSGERLETLTDELENIVT